jgi:hypothetical protein
VYVVCDVWLHEMFCIVCGVLVTVSLSAVCPIWVPTLDAKLACSSHACAPMQVPMYSNFIKEVFERCLDLYLCPRVRLMG